MSTSARRRLMRDFKVRVNMITSPSSFPSIVPTPFMTEIAHKFRIFCFASICFFAFPEFVSYDVSPRLTFSSSQRMQTDPPAGVSASPVADNVMTW
jgi:hypothetical protein